jgi:HAD superfamily hydrolase (TIGR01549 family)
MESSRKVKTLQAIFFDFDGVLVDSSDIKTNGFRILFKQYDDRVVDKIASYHQLHGGISRVDKIRHIHHHMLGSPLTDDELSRWAEEYSRLVLEKVINVDWIAGAEEFLNSAHGTIPVFVISGTPENELREIVRKRKIVDYFQEILGSPVRKPAHIRNLLSDYNLTPERCVFVGDALTDYNAAAETELCFIGIQGDVDFPAGTTVLPDCRSLQEEITKLFPQ